MKRDEYREEYLRSEHWRMVRLAALLRAEHRCQVCNGANSLDVHHRTYERLGFERDADLTVLCRGCHDLFHKVTRLNPTGATPGRENWSRLSFEEQIELQQGVLGVLLWGPRTSTQLAAELGRRTQVIGSCCSKLRKAGMLDKSDKTWRRIERPGWLSNESIITIKQAASDPLNAWAVARKHLAESPWSTAADVRDAIDMPSVTGLYDDWAYRVLAVAHNDGLVVRRNVSSGKRYRVQWALPQAVA